MRCDDDHAAQIKTLTKKIQCKYRERFSSNILQTKRNRKIIRMIEVVETYVHVIFSFQPAKEKSRYSKRASRMSSDTGLVLSTIGKLSMRSSYRRSLIKTHLQ